MLLIIKKKKLRKNVRKKILKVDWSMSNSVQWLKRKWTWPLHYRNNDLRLAILKYLNKANPNNLYTIFQNGRHFRILLFPSKLALMASFKVKYSFEFYV